MSSLDRPAAKPFLMSLASSALNIRMSPVVITPVAAVSGQHIVVLGVVVDARTETDRGGKRSIAGGSGEFRVDVSALIGETAGALVLAIGLCSGHPSLGHCSPSCRTKARRGRSREEFVDLVSRQNILDDEKVAECFEKGKPAYPATSALGGV
jgi:hypothetical protein